MDPHVYAAHLYTDLYLDLHSLKNEYTNCHSDPHCDLNAHNQSFANNIRNANDHRDPDLEL